MTYGNRLFLAAALALAATPAFAQEEIALLVTGGAAPAMKALIPGFESKTGYKVKLTEGQGATVKKQVAQGSVPFDVTLVYAPLPEILASGNVVTASEKLVASAAMGVAVKAGAPHPDISTPEAVKKLLLSTKTLSIPDTAGDSAAGVNLHDTLQKLGLEDQIRAKAKIERGGGGVTQDVVKGDVEFGIFFTSEIDPGAEIVGLLPASISTPVQTMGFVGSHAKDPKAAQALLDYLTSPAANAVYVSMRLVPPK